MGKIRRHLFTFIFLISIPISAFAAPVKPIFDAAQNFSGPIVFFWNTSTNAVASTYMIFISTTTMAGQTYAAIAARTDVNSQTAPFLGVSNANQNTIWSGGVSGQTYYVRMGVIDGAAATDIAANENIVTCRTEKLVVSGISSVVDGAVSQTLHFDTHTITYTINLKGDQGDMILPPAKISLDIQTSVNSRSVFVQTPLISMTVTVSSSIYPASNAVATYTWPGYVYTDNSHKHNGGYILTATPVDGNGNTNVPGAATYGTTVSVVHVNVGKGLVYQTVGAAQPHYGPPFYFNYYMSDDSFVTWKIWNQNGTSDRSDDTLLKVVVSSVPRRTGDSGGGPAGWDQAVQVESWDGRNSSGLILPNDIYAYTFDAYDYSTDHAVTVWGTIAFDVLRVVDVASTGITDTNPLAHIKYTLAGANSQAGGATVKIVICLPGTTYYMAAGAGTMNYANGTSTYAYVAGDPVPTVAANLKKVFVFARTAGALDETWNGFDETGTALPNSNYVFAISGTDDSGNHAIDNSGNDGIIIGNVTIDRTAAQTSTDATPPTITALSAGGTNMSLAGGAVLTSPFSTLSVAMSDIGSGVDLANSLVILTGPTTGSISVTTSNNGTDTLTLTFPQQSTNGAYTVRIRPRDKVGNTASDTIYNFTLNISASGIASAFAESTFAYPNPVKAANLVTFAYTVSAPSAMKLEVYNILGELIYQENFTAAQAGASTKTWNLVNQAGNKLATGVYLYRLTSDTATTTKPKLKKIIIIQ